jgi:hypothetical protein
VEARREEGVEEDPREQQPAAERWAARHHQGSTESRQRADQKEPELHQRAVLHLMVRRQRAALQPELVPPVAVQRAQAQQPEVPRERAVQQAVQPVQLGPALSPW